MSPLAWLQRLCGALVPRSCLLEQLGKAEMPDAVRTDPDPCNSVAGRLGKRSLTGNLKI